MQEGLGAPRAGAQGRGVLCVCVGRGGGRENAIALSRSSVPNDSPLRHYSPYNTGGKSTSVPSSLHYSLYTFTIHHTREKGGLRVFGIVTTPASSFLPHCTPSRHHSPYSTGRKSILVFLVHHLVTIHHI